MSKLHPFLFLKVAIPIPVFRLFDYRFSEDIDVTDLKPGIRIKVPFGNTTKTAVLIEITDSCDFDRERLKPVEQILDDQPLLSDQDLKLLNWCSRYYHHPLGEVMATAFPTALRKGNTAEIQQDNFYALSEKGQLLSPGQLKRAPRQQDLLKFFQTRSGQLNESDLKQWGNSWRATLKALIEKELIIRQPFKPDQIPELLKQVPLNANSQQQEAIEQIVDQLPQFSVFLLEGVTGSGKTEVYMQVIEQVLRQGLQVLVLLPEITLTPQLEQRFQQRFAVKIVSSHSRLTDRQRLTVWLQMQRGEASIMLGTRSALFTPLKRPGLIILDEEHDSSFKQQEGFRFSARDVAIVRARNLNIPIILGSATPSLESLFNIKQHRYQHLALSERAGQAVKPVFYILDIRNKKIHDGLSEWLISEIRKTMDNNEQILLFINRRGYAPVQMCHGCGYVSRCQHCDANMVVHFDDNRLRCHHCGNEQALDQQCPACSSGQLQAIGLGTERIEKTLAERFPNKKILRLDRDSTQRKGSLERYLEQINQGQIDIILGTQMLSKGHHFPNVTLVAILDVDSGLFSTDFHSAEKLAQMIVQVAGRAGRAEKQGRVILQTRQPDHPLLTTLINQGYQAFAEDALLQRKQAILPPYSFQALLRVHAANPHTPQRFLSAIISLLKTLNRGKTQILGPVPAPMARRAGQFRFQLLFQNEHRKELHQLLDILLPEIDSLSESKKVRWSLDVDPVDLY